MSHQERLSGVSFHFFKCFKKVTIKPCIHTPENICITLYIILSIILQLSGVLCHIGGVTLAAAAAGTHYVKENNKTGNFEFWYQ
jgi:hypothetical protein